MRKPLILGISLVSLVPMILFLLPSVYATPKVTITSPTSEVTEENGRKTLSIHEVTHIWNPVSSQWLDGRPSDYINMSINSSFAINGRYFNETFTMVPDYIIYKGQTFDTDNFMKAMRKVNNKATIEIPLAIINGGWKITYDFSKINSTLSGLQQVNFKVYMNAPDLQFITDDLDTNGFNYTFNGTDLTIYSPQSLYFDPTLTISGVTILCGSDTYDVVEILPNGQGRVCQWNGSSMNGGIWNYTKEGGNLTIYNGGWINATGTGYRAGKSTVNRQGESAKGLGGTSTAANDQGGGSGSESDPYTGGTGGLANTTNSTKGGGGGSTCLGSIRTGNGGGAIYVNVGSGGVINIGGNITTNGIAGIDNDGSTCGGTGGGAGGGITLIGQTINISSGGLNATGGKGGSGGTKACGGGGGGGGKILIEYGTLYNTTTTIKLTAGIGGSNGTYPGRASGGAGGGYGGAGGNGGGSFAPFKCSAGENGNIGVYLLYQLNFGTAVLPSWSGISLLWPNDSRIWAYSIGNGVQCKWISPRNWRGITS